MRNSLHSFDRTVTAGVVNLFGPHLRPFFEVMTWLGDPITVFVIAGALAAYSFRLPNMKMLIAAGAIPGTLMAGMILKILFERARPLTEYAAGMRLQTYSFPSGHSSGSVIAYGLLAYLAFMKLPPTWNVVCAAVLSVVPIFVGISRVYLGAHFPSDVVAGWILGIIVLALVVFVLQPLS